MPACWYSVGVATRPGLCPIAKETAKAAPTLCTEYGPNGWMDGWMDGWMEGQMDRNKDDLENKMDKNNE